MLKYFEINKSVSLLYLTNTFCVAVHLLRRTGERAFHVAAPHLWNKLPLQLRTIGSVETFKNSIKTFLFRQSFQ